MLVSVVTESRWRHYMKMASALLPLCEENQVEYNQNHHVMRYVVVFTLFPLLLAEKLLKSTVTNNVRLHGGRCFPRTNDEYSGNCGHDMTKYLPAWIQTSHGHNSFCVQCSLVGICLRTILWLTYGKAIWWKQTHRRLDGSSSVQRVYNQYMNNNDNVLVNPECTPAMTIINA